MTDDKNVHVHDDNCGCGHDHEEHDFVTLTLEDGSDLECPIIDIFDIEDQSYIALLHPVEETALLYRFRDNKDGTIEVTNIESDEEFEKVSAYMDTLMEGLE
jgi:uncharacterized protein YrzB (UPF0473 family)